MEGHGVSLEKIGAVGVSEEGHRVRHHPDVASAAVKVRLAPFAVLVRHDQHLVIKALRVCRVIVALLRIRVESCHKQKSVSLLKSIIFMSMLNSLVFTISILHNDTCVKNFGYITSVFFQFWNLFKAAMFYSFAVGAFTSGQYRFRIGRWYRRKWDSGAPLQVISANTKSIASFSNASRPQKSHKIENKTKTMRSFFTSNKNNR